MTTYEIVGIGNAIVDVISHADDSFLDLMGIEKGIMQLVERERAEVLYAAMQDRTQAPGGSVANTLAGIGAMGVSTAFIGRVRDDALGRFYAQAMEQAGTAFVNPPLPGDVPTSRSMIFVSPDGERSMNTYLGFGADLDAGDVPDAVARGAQLLFLEGYLYDKPGGKAAFEQAARLCHEGGGIAGISLSDPFCVDRHRADFQALVAQLDFVIGNVHEWESLYESDIDTALDRAAAATGVVVCTRSGEDVLLRRGDETAIAPVTRVTPVDATGAGDQFAAGFLFGLSQGRDLLTCGRMGNLAAAEVIRHIGARPQSDMRAVFETAGLL
ncbi:MAG: adenosine kinase [Rhodobacterales bacterium]|nr:MAG: adenosine kinase [Rhodobacterales bacterium]